MAYFDNEAWEAQIGSEGDVELSIVGILSFIFQFHVHQESSCVSFKNPQQTLCSSVTLMPAESTTRPNRTSTELTGRQRGKLNPKQFFFIFIIDVGNISVLFYMRQCVYLPSSHQVGRALQWQVWHAVVIFITTIPEGQLVQNKLLLVKRLK